MATTKKTETKKAAAKETVKVMPAAEVKTEVKAAAVPEPEVKKEPVKKEPVKKEPVKKTAAKDLKAKVYLQYAGREVSSDELVAAAKKAYTKLGHKVADIKTIEIYVKPEEMAAYYVVNGIGSEEHKISL